VTSPSCTGEVGLPSVNGKQGRVLLFSFYFLSVRIVSFVPWVQVKVIFSALQLYLSFPDFVQVELATLNY
jgi:hypothetical protein